MRSSRSARISKLTSLLLFITSIFTFGVVGVSTATTASAAPGLTFNQLVTYSDSLCSTTKETINYVSNQFSYSASNSQTYSNLYLKFFGTSGSLKYRYVAYTTATAPTNSWSTDYDLSPSQADCLNRLPSISAGATSKLDIKVYNDNSPSTFNTYTFTFNPSGGVAAPTIASATISGTAQVGSSLSAVPGTITGSSTTTAYKWQSSPTSAGTYADISGATSSSYTPTTADAGKYIKVVITVTNSGGNASQTSSATSAVLNAAPTIASASISGTAQVGSTLTANAFAITGTATTTYYQWRSSSNNGVTFTDISGATSSTYTPVAGDAGNLIKVVITVTNNGGSSSQTSSATPAVLYAAPTIAAASVTGTGTVGSTLTAVPGTITGSGTTTTYQWQSATSASGSYTNISSATASTYVVASGDAGKFIKVIIGVSNNGGTAIPQTSAAVGIAPTASGISTSSVAQTTANLVFTSVTSGTYYYLVYASGATAPSATAVVAQGSAVAKGTAAASGSSQTVSISGLSANNSYVAYLVVSTASGQSTVYSTTFSTIKFDQPNFMLSSASIPNGASLDLSTYVSGAIGMGSISYTLNSGSCSLTGSVITANAGSGSCSVTASIASDSSYNSASSTASISLTASAPAKPTALALSIVGLTSGGQVTFSWTAPVNTGNPAITSYEYQYKLSSSSTYTSGVKTTSSTSVTITGLGLNQSYDFQVRARNSMGAGLFADKVSGNSSGSTVSAPNTAPTLVSVTPGDSQLTVKFTYSLTPYTGDAAITGYQYSVDGTNWRSVTDSDGGDSSRQAVITGLTNGTTYPVYLRALNVAGVGTRSSTLSGTPFGKPTAPTGVTISKGSNKITVTFTPSSGNGSTISGYQYSRKNGNDNYGGWQDINSLTVGLNTNSFDISTGDDDKNKTIYIQVRAKTSNSLNGGDDNRGYSDASTAGTTTYTLAAPSTISAPASTTITKNATQPTFTVALTATPATTETLAYQWYFNTVNSASGGSTTLPAGVSASSGTLTFASTLATSMTGYYYLVVTSSISGTTATATSSVIRVIVNGALAVSNATVTLPPATVGKAYTYSFTSTSPIVISGGSTPYTWTIISKTNTSGLTDPTSGTINGTATKAGTQTWNIRVTDAVGATVTTTATLVVSNGPQILTKSLPSGTKNVNYASLNQSLVGANGTSPFTWSKVSGPSWLTIDPVTGALSGTPSSSGSNSVKVRYTDNNGAYDEATIVLGVADVVPTQVTGVTVTLETNHEVDLSWSPSTDQSSLSSYVVTYVSAKSGDDDEDRGSYTTTSNSVNSAQIKGLKNGRTYTFTVSGKNAGSVGPSSTSVNGTPYALPSALKSVTLVRSNGKLSVRFQKGDDDGGFNASSYSIQCSVDNGTTWSNATGDYGVGGDGEEGNRGYNLRDDGSNSWLTANASVRCRVAVVTTKGTGPYTTSAASSYQAVPSMPNNVTIDTSTIAAGNITVSFKISTTNGGSAITSYVASLDKDSGGDNESKRSCNYVLTGGASWDPTATYSCVIRSVPKKYSGSTSIKVVAVNSVGNSAPATVSIALTGKPQVLKADDEGGNSSFDGRDSHNLIFNKTYGDPDFAIKLKLDSGLKMNYQVATGGTKCSLTANQMVHILGVGQCTLSIVQTGRSNEGDGEHETDYSEFDSTSVTITVNIAPRKPAAPSFISVASGNGQLTPTINPPAGPVAPTNYIFRWSTSNSGGWSAFDTRTAVAGNAYTLTGLTNGTPYYIEVRSNNTAGSSDPVVTTTTYIPATIPNKPVITSVTIDTNTASAAVTWNVLSHPTQSGGSPVTSYRASATQNNTTYSCSVSGAGNTCVITNLPYKQQLTFQLTATNIKGSNSSDTQTATVSGWSQTINRGNDPGTYGHTVGDADIQLNATASSALPIQYSTSTGAICSVSLDGSVHIITSGVCTINMAQDGTNSKSGSGPATKYNAAPSVTGWTMNIDPNIPSAPVITSVINTPSGLQVNWNPPSRLGGGTITYTVNFSPYRNSNGQEVTTLTTKTLGSVDINKGDLETITVTAANSVGSSTSTSKSGKWQTIPGAPTNPAANASTTNGRALDVTWSDPTDNGGSTITSFTATATPDAAALAIDPSLTAQSCVTSTRACSILNLRAGATYTVTIFATNGIGDGGLSTALTSKTPGKSQTVSITGGNITKNFGAPAFTISASSTSGLIPTFATTGANCANASITSAGLFTYTGPVTACAVKATVVAATSSNETEFITANATITVTINAVAPNPAVVTSVVGKNQTLVISWIDPTFSGDGGAVTPIFTVGGVAKTCTTSPCEVTGLTNDTSYVVSITERNGSNLNSTAVTASGTPYLADTAPIPLTATTGYSSGHQITLNWSVPASAGTALTNGTPLITYELQYWPDGSSAGSAIAIPLITDTTTVTTAVTGLTAATTYHFRARANYQGAASSAWTQEAVATTWRVPDAPQNETITVVNGGLGSITVSWQAPANTGGTPITGFCVSKGDACEVLGANVYSKTYTNLNQNQAYTFTVLARNVVGDGPTSSASYTTISTPSAPVLTLTSSDPLTASAVLNWTTPANGGSAITSYTLTATPASGSPTSCIVAAPTTTCTTTGLLYKQNYTFTVVATNAAGNSVSSNTVLLDPMTLAQTITFTSPGDKSFAVATVVLNGVASSALPVTYTSNSPSVCTVPAPSSSSNSLVTFVGIGTCSITANQSGANSNYSAALAVGPVTFAVTSYAPDGIPLLQLSPGASSITAKWDPAVQLGGSTLKYYILSYSHNLDWSDESIIQTTSTTYQITGLAPNTSYQVRVAVQTNDYVNPSAYINVLTATTFDAPSAPGVPTWAPTDVDATTGSVTVKWSKSTSDGGTPITGYTARAYYASDNSDSGQSCTTITEVTTGFYSCKITGLKGSRLYKFGATATNAVGSTPSALSTNTAQPGKSQSITAVNGSVHHVANSYTIGATASSGLPVGYAFVSETRDVNAPSDLTRHVCVLDPTTGIVTVDVAGTCQVTVTQDGTTDGTTPSDYYAATPVTITITVIGDLSAPPPIITITSTSQSLTYTWSAPGDDGGLALGSGVTGGYGYHISWFDLTTNGPVTNLSVAPSVLTQTLNGLNNGDTYQVSITALNFAGESAA